jgi:putative ABC transport system substrate-binding protein
MTLKRRMKHKRLILIGMFLIIFLVFLTGCGEKTKKKKVYRVGILSGLNLFSGSIDGFKQGMAELGYLEGKNITYDLHVTNVEPDREQQILKKFINDQVDLIFAFPTEASLAAKSATLGTGIPVVFANAVIEGIDLVESMRRPGGNITGVRYPSSDLSVKRLEILLELVPQAKKIWIAYDQNYPAVPPMLEALHRAVRAWNITLVEMPADSIADIRADLDAREKLGDIGIDAILIGVEPLVSKPHVFAVVNTFAEKYKIPIGGRPQSQGEYGSIFGYAPNSIGVGKLAAPLADKIFKGIPAGTIPVVTPESHLIINYKFAKKIGLTVPEGLLSRADEIIR